MSRLAALAAASLSLTLFAGAASGAQGFSFVQIASGLANAVYVTTAPNDPATLYVVEQDGAIVTVRDGQVVGTFLDIRDRVDFDGERGLLSLAFHPAFAHNGLFYVDYTDGAGDIHVVEYTAANGAAVMSSARELLDVKHPWPNHNGGQLQFDRAGRLWVGIGDGGTDPAAGGASLGDPNDNAQSRSSRLGKLLRIDPTARGATWKTAEIGLRNPWRFSFDRRTGDLWIGDVGAALYEEIDFRPAAKVAATANFGWSRFEGASSYNPKIRPARGVPLVGPVYTYAHASGAQCAVVGGYVYRGTTVPAARGRYFFGDYCSGDIWSLTLTRGRAAAARTGDRLGQLSSFGEGSDGALYAVTTLGDLYVLR